MVDGLVITGSPLPTAEPSEIRLPGMTIMSALADWLQRAMRMTPRAAIGIRTLLSVRAFRSHGPFDLAFDSEIISSSPFLVHIMNPPISTCVAGAKNSLSRGRIFRGESADFVPVLPACNLPLHERMIRQVAVPVPPQLETILIQGVCFVRPSHAPEKRG